MRRIFILAILSVISGPQDPLGLPVQFQNSMSPQEVTPGKLYYIIFSSGAVNYADFQFNAPPGYTIYLASLYGAFSPHTTIVSPNYAGGIGNFIVRFYVLPNDGAKWLAPGYATPPKLGDVTWAVSAGTLTNGLSAGLLRWESPTVSPNLLDASSLQYVPTAPTIDPITYGFGALAPGTILMSTYSDGTIKYIGTYEVQIYVSRNAGTNSGYIIKVYSPTIAVTLPSNPVSAPWTFASSDYIEYTISDPDSPSTGRIQLSHLDRGSGLTDTWILSQSGSIAKMTQSSSSLRMVTLTSSSGPGSGQRTEAETVTDGSGANLALQKTRVYQTFPWGEELISDISDPSGLALTTTYNYYAPTTTGSALGDGHYSKLQSVTNPDGSWVVYDYFDAFQEWGQLAAVYTPWQDSPTAASSAVPTNCHFTTYSYAQQ